MHSLCSQCLRGDKAPKPFHHGDTENTENPVDVKLGHPILTSLHDVANLCHLFNLIF